MHQATRDLRNSEIMKGVLKIGEKAPAFELKNTQGNIFRLKEVLAEGPLVLSFFRGKWWPYCNLELEALQKAINEITSLNVRLAGIFPQLPEFNQALIKEKKLDFDLLSDPGNQVAKSFGLVFTFPDDLKNLYLQFGIDLAEHNGDDSWTLPMPGRFIIDRNSNIRYAEVNTDYTIRAEPEHTIAALKELFWSFGTEINFDPLAVHINISDGIVITFTFETDGWFRPDPPAWRFYAPFYPNKGII